MKDFKYLIYGVICLAGVILIGGSDLIFTLLLSLLTFFNLLVFILGNLRCFIDPEYNKNDKMGKKVESDI